MFEYLLFLFRNKWYITVEVIGISVALAFTITLLSFFSDKWEIDHGKDSAVRKVFGAIGGEEIRRHIYRYLKIVVAASVIGIILSIIINDAIILSYSYRLNSTYWGYILAIIIVASITFLSVYLQARMAAFKNPVLYLRDE